MVNRFRILTSTALSKKTTYEQEKRTSKEGKTKESVRGFPFALARGIRIASSSEYRAERIQGAPQKTHLCFVEGQGSQVAELEDSGWRSHRHVDGRSLQEEHLLLDFHVAREQLPELNWDGR